MFHANLSPASRKCLTDDTPEHLATILIEGIRRKDLGHGIESEEIYEIAPIPNWCFQRDPQIILGHSVIFSSMATAARNRETLLSTLIFRYHPAFKDTPLFHDPFQIDWRDRHLLGAEIPSLEGGDVLILSKEVIAVGQSERTNDKGIRKLAKTLASLKDGPRWLLVVELPHRRAYMHLDTIMTQINHHECLTFFSVLCEDGHEQARIYEIDLHHPDLKATHKKDLFSALKRRGIDLEPIPCGGSDAVFQLREQWTDGANAFALAPGVILLYDRNTHTLETLNQRGYKIVKADDILLGSQEVDLKKPTPTCIMLPSHEISRARGGPHCLTHPLERM